MTFVKKPTAFIVIFINLICSTLLAQSLPTKIDDGRCYKRYVAPDIYEQQTFQLQVSPTYKEIKVIPASYLTISEEVLVKEAYNSKIDKDLNDWKVDTIFYEIKEPSRKIEVLDAIFSVEVYTKEIKPTYAVWTLGEKIPDCDSSAPDDCRYWAYKSISPEKVEISIQNIVRDATIKESKVESERGYYLRHSLSRIIDPGEVLDMPAEYKTIKRLVLTKDATTKELQVPATFQEITKDVLVEKGGLIEWREVECEMLYEEDFFNRHKKYYEETPTFDKQILTYKEKSNCKIDEIFFRDLEESNGYRFFQGKKRLYFYKDVDTFTKVFQRYFLIEIFSFEEISDSQILIDVKYFVTRSKYLDNMATTDRHTDNFKNLIERTKKCVYGEE